MTLVLEKAKIVMFANYSTICSSAINRKLSYFLNRDLGNKLLLVGKTKSVGSLFKNRIKSQVES